MARAQRVVPFEKSGRSSKLLAYRIMKFKSAFRHSFFVPYNFWHGNGITMCNALIISPDLEMNVELKCQGYEKSFTNNSDTIIHWFVS